jgi:hypothetical protein
MAWQTSSLARHVIEFAEILIGRYGEQLDTWITSSGTAPVMRDPVARHVECPAMLARGWRRGAAASALLRL